ncbi:MAG: gamma-glutamyl-gamma-aminobutyrate hydrolase family protein [Candidatus Hydrogenedentes bacterium]|nr:gamma-glutamyl-gamma-aminobutyrate hydrolase family protein [Candidatus Hydrogenedentota bacterium]
MFSITILLIGFSRQARTGDLLDDREIKDQNAPHVIMNTISSPMRALIGITGEFEPGARAGRPWNKNELLCYYAEAVARAGGAAVMLPLADPDTCAAVLGRLDGLVLSGGKGDIPPEAYGETAHPSTRPLAAERWRSECLWLRTARSLGKPILGICLGMQVLTVEAGGRLIQDIPDLRPGALPHTSPTGMEQHDVVLTPDTCLAAMAPDNRVQVTSSHHQSIVDVPPGYRLAATSEDGLIEAVESPSATLIIGVQWHPERSLNQPDWLLVEFVKHCGIIG